MARDELVTIVDTKNRETGVAPRWKMRAERLRHRATFVFVFDHAGLLYVQHRTESKDIYPGYYDLAAGGVMQSGESYDQSAERELAEEMGIEGVPLEKWFDFYFEDAHCKVWGRAYGCVYEGALQLQEEEVQSVDRMDVAAILSGTSGRQFTPDSLHALKLRFA